MTYALHRVTQPDRYVEHCEVDPLPVPAEDWLPPGADSVTANWGHEPLKGFERIDLQNLIRQMPGYKEGSELQAEIRSSARSPSRCRRHGMCTTPCPEVFAINDDGYAEVRVPEVPDGARRMRRAKPLNVVPNKRSAREIVMPKGYVIVTGTIHDPEGMKAYNRLASRTISEGGGKVLVLDTKPEVLEGDWQGSQTVVLEFASVDAARAWYESAGYQKAAKQRQAAADSNAVILSGFGD